MAITYEDWDGQGTELYVLDQGDGSYSFVSKYGDGSVVQVTLSVRLNSESMAAIREEIRERSVNRLDRANVKAIAAEFQGGDTSDSTPIDDDTYDVRLLFPLGNHAERFIKEIQGRVRYAAILAYEQWEDVVYVQVICERVND